MTDTDFAERHVSTEFPPKHWNRSKTFELDRPKRSSLKHSHQKTDTRRFCPGNDLVSTISHELHTPLTSILAFSEILLNNPDMDEAKRQQFLGIVVREAERLSQRTSDLLNQIPQMEYEPAK